MPGPLSDDTWPRRSSEVREVLRAIDEVNTVGAGIGNGGLPVGTFGTDAAANLAATVTSDYDALRKDMKAMFAEQSRQISKVLEVLEALHRVPPRQPEPHPALNEGHAKALPKVPTDHGGTRLSDSLPPAGVNHPPSSKRQPSQASLGPSTSSERSPTETSELLPCSPPVSRPSASSEEKKRKKPFSQRLQRMQEKGMIVMGSWRMGPPKRAEKAHAMTGRFDLACGRHALCLKVVSSMVFEILCACAIILNAIFCGVKAQVVVMYIRDGRSPPPQFLSGDKLFSMLFFLEWVVRVAAYQRKFFAVKEGRWHIFDTMLVAISVVELLFAEVAQAEYSQGAPSTVLRVIRIMTLTRLLRVVRYFGIFRELRLIVYGLFKSAQSLAWSMVFLCLVIYFFSVCFQLLVNGQLEEYMAAERREGSLAAEMEEHRGKLHARYGSFAKTMMSLFMAISGGLDWLDCMAPLADISKLYAIVFIGYIMLTMYGVLNVMTAIFVESAMVTSKMDRDIVIMEELAKRDSYMSRMRDVFEETDSDGSGTICWDEFSKHLNDERVIAYFHSLELDISEAKSLFRLLDQDESDEVNIEEFISGCFRLKGNAKGVDLQALMYENKRMMQIWVSFMAYVEVEFDTLNKLLEDFPAMPMQAVKLPDVHSPAEPCAMPDTWAEEITLVAV
mmetsp:Transcript_66452/g.149994  ORF Transcript_66452/g.149994 Transcript_66452/m.149994 type:complete len:673 (+) Transcript_66452:72-2090(+)